MTKRNTVSYIIKIFKVIVYQKTKECTESIIWNLYLMRKYLRTELTNLVA
jgi:hypothetical protein